MGHEIIVSDYKLTAEWFTSQLDLIWQPFLLGSLICGIISAVIAYSTMRLLWRLHIIRHLKERRKRRKRLKQDKSQS